MAICFPSKALMMLWKLQRWENPSATIIHVFCCWTVQYFVVVLCNDCLTGFVDNLGDGVVCDVVAV